MPLVSKEKHIDMIHVIANLINFELGKKNQNQNKLHGYLLQLKGLISDIYGSNIYEELKNAVISKVSSTDVLNEHGNYLVKSTYLEIVQILLNKWHGKYECLPTASDKWGKVFKNGPRKIYERQPLQGLI